MAKGGIRPGQGRKSKAEEARMRDKVSPYIPNAIECVVQIMQSGEKDADRLAAAKLLIEYYAGKPTQAVTHSGNAFESISVTIKPFDDGGA